MSYVGPIRFTSAKEFVIWLIDNEGLEIRDHYGRRWKYKDLSFWFQDIGTYYKSSIECVHLYGTNLEIFEAES